MPPVDRSLPPRHNLELKAHVRSLQAARQIARELSTDYVGVQVQTDTYFHCRNGRLKLREIVGQPAVLIPYLRPNEPHAKGSDYRLIHVADAGQAKSGLEAVLGVLTVVRKRREIFLWENVRIHLDEVDGLGTFLEFEAVIVDTASANRAPQQLQQLCARFGVQDEDLITGSYAEMLAAETGRIAEAPPVH
jgi:predicted adenylyl cyclase CyaB